MRSRTPHRPEGLNDFLHLLAVCSVPNVVVCVGVGFALHGAKALPVAVAFGIAIGLGATMFGWWFARRSWSNIDRQQSGS